MTEEQTQQVPEVKAMIDDPPEEMQEWSKQIDAEPRGRPPRGPRWFAFARENGTIYHTYTVMAPDPFVAPYHSFLLERTPKEGPSEARIWRKDEYPDWAAGTCRVPAGNRRLSVLPLPGQCPARPLKDHRGAIPRQRRSSISARDNTGGGCAQSPSRTAGTCVSGWW
jgi:hypothetical protein